MWTDVGRFRFNGRAVRLEVITGEVLGTEQRSDTHVSGGGSTYTVGNSVQGSTNISSNVIVTRNIRLKTQDGGLHDIQLQGDFPLSTGDRLSIFAINDHYYRVYNHTTRQEFALPFNAWISPIYGLIAVGSFAAGIVYALLWQSGQIFFLGAMVMMVMSWNMKLGARSRSNALARKFREVAKDVLAS